LITAGIDVGVENARVVILKDGKIAGRADGESGGAGRPAAVDRLWEQALSSAGISAGDVGKLVVTGKGKHNICFADDQVTEPMAACKAAKYFFPDATAVMDAGADETLVATMKGEKIGEFVINEKCAAGIGKFLTYMARRLEMTPEELGKLGRPGKDAAVVNDGCMVFAELDALGLLNRGVPPKEVAAAAVEAAAVRASTVLFDITIPKWDKFVLVGGVARNAAFVNALKVYARIDILVPEGAEYAGALGAAIFATL
jgi:predicted CoA-substrate-specific enzyme activase